MKNFFKENGSLILFICIVIVLTVIILFIVCNRYNYSQETNSIVTFIGIILAFISIFLSYKALVVTNKVKQEVGLQQFRIKQHEEVALFVNAINIHGFDIIFNVTKDDGKCSQACVTANLYGMVDLLNEKNHNFKEYSDCPVFYVGNNPLEFAYNHIGNPYLPKSIAIALSRFIRIQNNQKENNKNKIGNYVRFSEIMEKGDTFFGQISPVRLSDNWESLVANAESLIKNIKDWYKDEYFDAEVNLYVYKKVKKCYPPKQ